jgi:hypothetical protein
LACIPDDQFEVLARRPDAVVGLAIIVFVAIIDTALVIGPGLGSLSGICRSPTSIGRLEGRAVFSDLAPSLGIVVSLLPRQHPIDQRQGADPVANVHPHIVPHILEQRIDQTQEQVSALPVWGHCCRSVVFAAGFAR